MLAATNNKHKLIELKAILSTLGIELKSMSEAGVRVEPEETGTTFAENAKIKAMALYEATGQASVADDSGLAVDALDGAPGVYSARYGGEGLDDAGRTALLLKNLSDVPKGRRGAKFVSAICAVLDDGSLIEVEGEVRGELLFEPDGNDGFGYDPIFYCPELGCSFARALPEEKNRVSHRARALEAFAAEYKKRIETNDHE